MPYRCSFAAALLLLAQAATQSAGAPRPLIVGHRGLIRHAPENTRAGFRACLELRLGFEFDVDRAKDGRLICLHDGTVDRTTTGKGRASDLTAEDIRRLDAGSRFDPKFTGETVPTIEEVLKLLAEYKGQDVLVTVDLKTEGVEEEVVRLAEKHKVLHRLLFIGKTISEPKVRERLKHASRQAITCEVAHDGEELLKAMAAPDADWVYLRFLPTREQMNAVHQKGKRAFLAGKTVAGHLPDNWRQATAAGVDGILTDYPLELAAQLRAAQRK